MMRSRSGVSRAVREVAALVPLPWNRDDFVRALSEWLGRPVRLTARPMAPGCHTLLLDFGTHCEIYYDVLDSPDQADLSILHEVGHIVLGHALLLDELGDQLLTSQGCVYPPALNAEADDFAARMLTRISSTCVGQAVGELGRIAAILR
jgi:hypothetical protein